MKRVILALILAIGLSIGSMYLGQPSSTFSAVCCDQTVNTKYGIPFVAREETSGGFTGQTSYRIHVVGLLMNTAVDFLVLLAVFELAHRLNRRQY